jgi:hypothetical protein
MVQDKCGTKLKIAVSFFNLASSGNDFREVN